MQNVICPNLLSRSELIDICRNSTDEFIQELGIRLEGDRDEEFLKCQVDDLIEEKEDLEYRISNMEDDLYDLRRENERLKERIEELES